MELRHLRYFLAVADELHFGRAANRLGISQPPLSHQIQQLEDELGVRLFQRTKRQVALTEAGKAFMKEAKLVMAHADRAVHSARLANEGQLGQVTVGFVDSTMISIVPKLIRTFSERYPQVKLSLEEMQSADQIAGILEGRIDIGIIFGGPQIDRALESAPLFRAPWIVALPAGHALARETEIRLEAIADEPIILFSHQRRYGSYEEFVRICRNAGFLPRVIEDAAGMLAGLGLVAAGIGIALVSPAGASISFPEVVFRPIATPMPGIEVVAIWRRDESAPAVLAFLSVI